MNIYNDKTPNSRIRVVMAGPLPPLIGGMATVIQDVSQSCLSSEVELELFNTIKIDRSRRLYLWDALVSRIKLWWEWWRVLGSSQYTIAHIHTCSGLSFFLDGVLLVLARLKRCSVVVHIHGGRFDRFLDDLPKIAFILARWVSRRATKIVVLSEEWREKLTKRLGRYDLVVIENGVPVPNYQKLYDICVNKITVFFIGSLSKEKGVFDLLEAMSGTDSKITLVIAGSAASSDINDAIQKKILTRGLKERVQCVGTVIGEEKQQWFRAADIFVLPSYIEGLPISLLEAMCVGLPVITTPVGGIPSVVQQDQTGILVKPGDVQGLRDAIQTLAGDVGKRQSLGMKARIQCTKNHSIETTAKRYLQLYNTIMEPTKR